MSEVRNYVFGTASQTFGLGRDYEILDFYFRHTEKTPYSASEDHSIEFGVSVTLTKFNSGFVVPDPEFARWESQGATPAA